MNISYGELFFIALFLGTNGIWFASYYSRFIANLESTGAADADAKLRKFGSALGMNTMITMVFLIIPATRNSFWMNALNIDYSHGVKYHRWLGYATFILLVGHVAPYYKSWLSQGTFIASSLPCWESCDYGADGRTRLSNFFGQVAFLAIIIMVLTSLNVVRRRYYEVFYYSHHLFIVVIIGSVLHFGYMIVWLYPIICLYAIQRILSRSQSSVPCEVVDLQAIPGEITRVVFKRSLGNSGYFHAGQFVYLKVPLVSKTQWHPFSVSAPSTMHDDTFSVHVKCLGGWTKSLYAIAIQAEEERKLPLIYVDGFYGSVSDDFTVSGTFASSIYTKISSLIFI